MYQKAEYSNLTMLNILVINSLILFFHLNTIYLKVYPNKGEFKIHSEYISQDITHWKQCIWDIMEHFILYLTQKIYHMFILIKKNERRKQNAFYTATKIVNVSNVVNFFNSIYLCLLYLNNSSQEIFSIKQKHVRL